MDRNQTTILLAATEHHGLLAIQRSLKKAAPQSGLLLARSVASLTKQVEAHRIERSGQPCVVLVDLTGPTRFGREALQWIRSHSSRVQPLIAAAIVPPRNLALVLEAYEHGAVALLTVPVNGCDVAELLDRSKRVTVEPSPVAPKLAVLPADICELPTDLPQGCVYRGRV